MAIWQNEAEAREQIKALVAQYYHDFKEKRENSSPVTESITHPGSLMRRKCAP